MQNFDENEEIMRCMMDDDFQRILENDPVLDMLEKSKHDAKTSYFELMMCLSRVFRIDGVTVSCITPAVWAYLYAIGSPYTQEGEVTQIDTDIFLYILHNGIKQIDEDLVDKAAGFCESHGINLSTAEYDLRTLIYLTFRPLEMLAETTTHTDKPRFDLEWLTHLVSVVAPQTNRTSEEIIYDMSLCECLYYCVQQAKQYDYKHEIRRRNSDEINGEIYLRTMELGRQYWQEHYKGKC